MSVWRAAYGLALVELRKSIWNLLMNWFILTVISLGILLLYNFMSSPDPYHDFIFFIIFIGVPYFFRKKEFRYNNIKDTLWAAPTIIHHLQLPIPRKVIVRSRLITYWFYFIPFFVTVFILLYAVDGIVGDITFIQFIAFTFIWFAFSMSFGLLSISYDVGHKIVYIRWFFINLLPILIIIFAYLAFYKTYYVGIVITTVKLAQNWPLISMLVSIPIIFFSLKWWPFIMEQRMKKNDYNC